MSTKTAANPSTAESRHDPVQAATDIALIGMAGRFPGAAKLSTFWDNLCAGRHSITFFEEAELKAAGVREELLNLPNYVPASGVLSDYDLFDAAFFGMSPSEAEILDPQQRLFLEMSWEALEGAGYDPFQYPGSIGIFAGLGTSTYLMNNLAPHIHTLAKRMDMQQILLANEKDYLPLRVAFKLDLRGPAINVQTACSTSLVAVHLACQSLINGECDLAMAGGIRFGVPVASGYLYQEGHINSPDGLCRAFDAEAAGTVSGDGGGVVLMKMLADAQADGDRILAVIKGSAVNNDGRDKISFTAPSIEGQAAAIREAMAVGGVDPATVSLIETHGTGTPLGDPIEIAALAQAFGVSEKAGYCALTATKANIGHLDSAAGVAGLIKTVLALQHKTIPPSANFKTPNPKIDFKNSPFFVNTQLRSWERMRADTPLRAGVSSFGMGGTNAHVTLEEAPEQRQSDPAKPWQFIPLSAKNLPSLQQRIADLEHMLGEREPNLADLAFTLQIGRSAFPCRTGFVVKSREMLLQALADWNPSDQAIVQAKDSPLVFVFTGQGAQKVGMGRELYQWEAVFRETIDFCADTLLDLGFGEGLRLYHADGTPMETLVNTLDLRTILFPDIGEEARAEVLMRQTGIAQVALFACDYAISELLASWGLIPEVMIGHSLGEYVAATLAEVMTLEDALYLVEQRGRLMQGLPAGAMLAVKAEEAALTPLLKEGLSLAVVNSANQCVVSGPIDEIATLRDHLEKNGSLCRALVTSHAFHSAMMEPMLDAFKAVFSNVALTEPSIPFISNLTGRPITDQQATSPDYWCDHLRGTVRFDEGLATLFEEPSHIFLEIGPGKALTQLAKRHRLRAKGQPVIATLPQVATSASDLAQIHEAVLSLWQAGTTFDWQGYHQHARRNRLALPTYPFQRKRFWIEAPSTQTAHGLSQNQAPLEEPLTRVAHERPDLHTAFSPPETDEEQTIAGIWGELLCIDQLGVDDDFLDIGGDSLITTQIHARLRDVYQLDLPLQPLFEHNTIAQQAAWIVEIKEAEALKPSQPGKLMEPMLPVPRDAELPLSFAQQRLWILDQIEGSNPAYHMAAVLNLEGRLVRVALEDAFSEIVRRHETMRTSFPAREGHPTQIIHAPTRVPIEFHDLRAMDPESRERQLPQRIADWIAIPFDLAQAPCFRITLFQMEPQRHVLAMAQHHIISDGWSMGVLVQEIAALYPAALAGKALDTVMNPLEIQYADFAHWQRQWLVGAVLEGQLAYWRKQLSGLPAHIDLPTDRPHPPLQTFAGAVEHLEFDSGVTAKIRNFAKSNDATLFMALEAVFATLLFRHTHQTDIAVGTPIANRKRRSLEPMVGCFINTLVLRTNFEGDPNFNEILAQTRDIAHGAYAHQDLPFEEVVEAVQPQRDLSRNPLFQVMFVLQNTPQGTLELPHLDISLYRDLGHYAKFELQVDVYDLGSTLACHFEYNTDLFDASTIQRLARHFHTLTEQLMAHPQVPVSRLAFLEDSDRQRLIGDWNATKTIYDCSQNLLVPFEQWAKNEPQRVAVRLAAGCEFLTYGSLNQRAEALAVKLGQLGVRPESLVGVYLHRSMEMVIALYGILKAGAAYVPIDPDYPGERVAFMVRDSNASVLITSQTLKDQLPPHDAKVICLESQETDFKYLSSEENTDLRHSVASTFTPARAAYMIYTSGSTGKPKGAINSHAAICNRLNWMQDAYGLTPDDRILQKTPFSFDVSVWEFFWPLRCGAELIMAEPDRHGDPEALTRMIEDHKITTLHFVPSMLNAFLEAADLQRCQSLTQVFASGEALSADLSNRFFQHFAATKLHNLYGPTEAAIDVTFHPCQTRESGPGVPIGKPIANTQIYILDRQCQLVPQGVSGELMIAGINLARGYHHRPDLTAQRFIPNPWGDGTRIYRTGDLARFSNQGELEFQGRLDHQVKLRGFRIELGDIEASLLTWPDFKQAVALVKQTTPQSEPMLVAFVADEHGPDWDQDVQAMQDTADLRAHLSLQLPKYMIPAMFVPLKSFPLTPNGKLDRRKLESLIPSLNLTRQEYIPPRTATERTLAEIWTQLLPVSKVGIEDNFFELGGDSILAIQIISKARLHGFSFTPKQLFEWPTIAQLAQQVREAVSVLADQNLITGPLPLTPVQHWFLQQGRSQPHHFNQSLLLALNTAGDAKRFRQAIHAVINHHDALRMGFRKGSDQWQQINGSLPLEPPFRIYDFTRLGGETQAKALEQVCTALQTDHQLHGKLMQIALFECRDDKGCRNDRLFITIHHLVIDGVSWRILLEDLMAAYQMATSEPIQLPAKTTAFRDWSHRLQQYAQTDPLAAEIPYWQQILGQHTATVTLPLDTAPGDQETASQALNLESDKQTVTVALNEDLTHALLTRVPPVYNTRINDLLLSALMLSYNQWTNASTLLVDLEGHGRENLFADLDISRTIGWFTTIFPVRLTMSQKGELGETLKGIKEQLRSAPNNGLGFGLLRYLRQEEDVLDWHQLPKVDILFNYLGRLDTLLGDDAPITLAPESSGPENSPDDARSHVLIINAQISGGKLQISFEYAAKLHLQQTIETLAGNFTKNLEALIQHCQQPEAGGKTPSDFPLAAIDQVGLDRLIGHGKEVDELWPLTPMQAGMLFHSLVQNTNAYHQQFSAVLEGELNQAAFLEAWSQLFIHHSSLRARFFPEEPDHVFQAIMKQVDFPHEFDDWRQQEDAEQALMLAEFLEQDRKRGFKLAEAPLMRFAMFRIAENRYRFILSNHHLLMDGWSLPILLRELFARYERILGHKPQELVPSGSFRQYLTWLQQQDKQAAESFWRTNLAGFTSATPLEMQTRNASLSAKRSHLGIQTFGEVSHELNEAQAAELRHFSKKHHLTLNTLVQASWAFLLGLYAGEQDVVFGATVSGRPPAVDDVETIVGMFINTLPVRIGIPTQRPILEWLHDIQNAHLTREQFSFSPLVDIQRWSDLDVTQPLFESLLVFENYPLTTGNSSEASQQNTPSLWLEHFDYLEQTNYPLVLTVNARTITQFVLTFDQDRFQTPAMETLMNRFIKVLMGFLQHDTGTLSQIHVLESQERKVLLADWNQTQMAFPKALGIHHLFEEQTRKTPDAIALRMASAHGFDELTYSEVNQRAEQLANYLCSQGAGPDQLLGMACERSFAMVVALLGILKSGAAYVPMDPQFPKERLAWMVEDSDLALIITDASIPATIAELGPNLIRLNARGHLLDVPSPWPSHLPRNFDAEALAYTIYTSGSTGKPKGVQLSHRSVVNFLTSMAKTPGISPDDVLCAVTTISFDIAGLELYLPLMVGAKVVLASSETAADGRLLAQLMASSGATVMQATPATWQMLLAADWPGDPHLKILCGGEALPGALALKLLKRSRSLWNMYGPTETTIWSTTLALDSSLSDAPSLSIGHPIGNTTAYVLDAFGEPVPLGIPGHLFLGGQGLARGYRNRPALTAETFIPDGFSMEPGARLYATGDFVRYENDGRLVYLSRIDHQIKLRGYRIELGEIEAVLEQVEGVQKSVALVREDRPGDQQLVAYYVTDSPEHTPLDSELRTRLAASLPAYMIPSGLMKLDTFPMTPNRKINRKALPAPERQKQSMPRPLQTPTQELVASIWSEVLGTEVLGSQANFFELGGHSLLAAQVLSRVRKQLDVTLPLNVLFESPTVMTFSHEVQVAKDAGIVARPAMTKQPRQGAGPWSFPLSFAQQQLWLHQQITGDSRPYHMPLSLQVDGPLVVQALEQAFGELLRRHESLRTTFETHVGQGVQVVHAEAPWNLAMADLSDLPADVRQLVIKDILEANAREPFDLAHGPLFRARLLKLAPAKHLIVLNQHHIISDAWSLGNLATELTILYTYISRQKSSPLADLPLQYADFSHWQSTWFEEGLLKHLSQYWRHQLAGLDHLQPLPLAKPRPVTATLAPGVVYFQLPTELVESIRLIGRQEGATLFMVLLAGLNTLTSIHTQSDDIAIGTDVANREFQEQEALIGFFVNQIVLRTQLEGAVSFKDVLELTRQCVFQGYAHQQLPFDQIVSMLNPERLPHVNPLFQMKLVLQNVPVKPQTVECLRITPLPQTPNLAKFDLLWNMQEIGGEVHCDMQFNLDMYSKETCKRLARHLTRILEIAVNRIDIPLASISLQLGELDHEQETQNLAEMQLVRTKLFKKAKRRQR